MLFRIETKAAYFDEYNNPCLPPFSSEFKSKKEDVCDYAKESICNY